MNRYFGVCIGASTITFVEISSNSKDKWEIEQVHSFQHNGLPRQVFTEKLKLLNPKKFPTVVTGRKIRNVLKLPTISEVEAVETAFKSLFSNKSDFKAISSLGSETFIVYVLDKNGNIVDVVTRNQCASGTGEFFLQQLKRMNINIDELHKFQNNVTPFKVSGRCSVFCKSDCTHALNKGVPKEEVLAGLAMMMADKVEELLHKVDKGKILLIGGVTQNKLVLKYLIEKEYDVVIPEEATYFEALGAAIFCLQNNVHSNFDFDNLFSNHTSSFIFHKPLSEYKHLVEFKAFERGKAKDGDVCIVGLDVGSTTTKGVVLRVDDCKILASSYIYTHGEPIKAARKVYAELAEQIGSTKIKIIGLGTTGSGRQVTGLHALTKGVFNEIIAHATAAIYFDPNVDTIFEIGGQDAKYTYLVNRVPADYAMNEACSAGTGSFIEESAFESLGIKTHEIEKIAFQSKNPPNFSDQCAAFISSDIKTAQNENIPREDIVAGLVYSVCLNYINRVKGNRQIGNVVFMQGGVCYNRAIPVAMAGLVGKKIIVPPEPGLMGAFGVALQVKEKIELGLLEPQEFSLEELAQREVTYKTPFICMGGKEKCDLRCQINRIVVNGKTYPFGGACNKFYNLLYNKNYNIEEYDFIAKRNSLLYEYSRQEERKDSLGTIGINLSYHTFTILPLLSTFFNGIGYKVVLPDEPDPRGFDREHTSFCFPAQISLCMFQNLLDKNPDYYFLPEIFEMWTAEDEPQRLDFNSSCVFVSGEPFYLKQAFKDYNISDKIISLYLNFANGFDKEKGKFVEIAKKLGVDKEIAEKAFNDAIEKQMQFFNRLEEEGAKFLDFLKENPDKFAVVLVGRPYNSFTSFTNKGIPQKFASRGVYIIPYEFLSFKNYKLDESQFWEAGKKILKTAKAIRDNEQLFPVYITNFSCGPDSMLIPQFRKIIGTRPSLTLELDQHTADAGINTRIDAFLDIVDNFRAVKNQIKHKAGEFRIAEIQFDGDDSFFVCSDGRRIPLRSKEIDVLIPSMGDLAAPLFAATLRGLGFNAKPMPESNPEILKLARSVSTGKECLPLLLLVGHLLNYIENLWDRKQKIAYFIVQGAGNCRLGQYPVFIRNLIRDRKIPDVATLVLMNEDGFAGLGSDFALRGIQAIIASDVLDDIRSAILANAVNPEEGIEIFHQEYQKLLLAFEHQPKKIYKALKDFALTIRKKVPSKVPIQKAKYIALVGEIYVRRDHFAHRYLNKYFASKGFVLKDAYISEWIFYVDYLLKLKLLEPDTDFRKKLERWTRVLFMRIAEHKIKKNLALSGYYEYSRTLIEPILNHSKHLIPLEYKGEPGLTLGIALKDILEKYCGVVNVGPFGCMPTRLAEAVSVPEMKVQNKITARKMNNPAFDLPLFVDREMPLPFLTIESDGNPYPQVIEAKLESFVLKAEKVANLMEKIKMNGKYKG
ncbi:MAG: (R)-2-hydroxyglutaryl-CoA dehydratase activator-related protein [Candidatus Kapaibacterium sp.]|nr:MAG: (R)-2-hydroxyglutaryl-CoA dehydratase activator-related protein [Candidatus Kapabacteria bacterium]